MKQHFTLSNVLVLLLLIGQLYLMYKINQKDEVSIKTLEATQGIIEQNKAAIEAGNKLIERYDRDIASKFDTLRIIENRKTFITNNYEKDLAHILTADSGAQFDLYRHNVRRYDSLFTAGFFFAGDRK